MSHARQPSNAAAAEAGQLLIVDPVADYEKLHRIGEGTYGVVYKARDRRTGEIVALKKVRFERTRDGVPVTSLRELRVLQQCPHPNIVRLKAVVTGSKADSVFLVFEYLDADMGRVLDNKPTPFTLPQIKQLMLQLLEAVAHLHQHWILHRDIKMSNLLYHRTGELKLCDLGLARYFSPEPAALTPRVVTLWYRAPELLLGAEVYGEAIDMWAVGCVLGELLAHKALFPAKTELEALRMQVDLLGTPTPATWPGMSDLPHGSMFKLPDQPRCKLHTLTDPHTSHTFAAQQGHRARSWSPPGRHSPQPSNQHHHSTWHESDRHHSHQNRRQQHHRSRSPSNRARSRSTSRGRRRHGSRSRSRDRSGARARSRSPGRSHSYRDTGYDRGGYERVRGRSPAHGHEGRRDRQRVSPVGSRSVGHQRRHREPALLDLLRRLLCWDPSRRLSAQQALQHPWFTEEPLACPIERMPSAPIPEPHGHAHGHAHGHGHHHHHNDHKGGAGVPGARLRVDQEAEAAARWAAAFGDDKGTKARSRVVFK